MPVNRREVKITNQDDLLTYTKLRNEVQDRIICNWWVGGRSVHKKEVDIKSREVDRNDIGKWFGEGVSHDELMHINTHTMLGCGSCGIMTKEDIIRDGSK